MNKITVEIDIDASVSDILDGINAAKAKAEAEAGPWVPGGDVRYWFADNDNRPTHCIKWVGSCGDKGRLAARNVWRTEEDCQWYCDLRDLNQPHGPMAEKGGLMYFMDADGTANEWTTGSPMAHLVALKNWLVGLAHVDESEAKRLPQRRHEFAQRPVPKEAMR